MFKPGDKVIYAPTNKPGGKPYKQEPGIVKRMNPYRDNIAFVWYHAGCTAASTDVKDLRLGEMADHERAHTGCHECAELKYKD